MDLFGSPFVQWNSFCNLKSGRFSQALRASDLYSKVFTEFIANNKHGDLKVGLVNYTLFDLPFRLMAGRTYLLKTLVQDSQLQMNYGFVTALSLLVNYSHGQVRICWFSTHTFAYLPTFICRLC